MIGMPSSWRYWYHRMPIPIPAAALASEATIKLRGSTVLSVRVIVRSVFYFVVSSTLCGKREAGSGKRRFCLAARCGAKAGVSLCGDSTAALMTGTAKVCCLPSSLSPLPSPPSPSPPPPLSRPPPRLPFPPTSSHRRHVGVSHLLKIVSRQRRPKPATAIENQLGALVRHALLDVALEYSPAEVLGAADMTCRPLTLLADVDQPGFSALE